MPPRSPMPKSRPSLMAAAATAGRRRRPWSIPSRSRRSRLPSTPAAAPPGAARRIGAMAAVAAAALEHVLRLRLLERRLRQLRRCRLVRRWLGRRLDTRALQQLRCFAALCGQSGSGLYRSWSDAALRDLFAGHGLSACRQLSLRSGIWPRPGAGTAAVLLASLLSSALCLSCADVCASALLRRALSRLLASSGRLARLIARQRSIKDSTKARVMRAFVFSTIAFDQAVAREAM